ncbi:MAG: choice-of-anchor D domain-containing protein [Bacteroidetes bacterium]|nr:choice-of-anchor D domain-containing protein [Bacteroidota bacterium]
MKNSGITIFIFFFLLGSIVQAQNSLVPPYNLQAQVINDNVQLNWSPPDTTAGDFLSWDNGITGNSIGLGGEGGTYAVAARWDSEQLTPWVGYTIDKLAFFLAGDEATYSARIWRGENADSLAWSENITSTVVDDWTFVYLNNTLYIDNFQDLWVGYEVNQPIGEFPAGADDGPAVAGYGDMVNLNGEWESLYSSYFLDNNFNVRVYVSNGNKSFVLNYPLIPAQSNYSNVSKPFLAAGLPINQNKVGDMMSDVIGYNVYRNNDLIASLESTDTSYLDEDPGTGIYNYGVSAVYPSGESNVSTVSVQLGTQEITVTPNSITDSVYIGQSYTTSITIANTGELDVYWILYSPENWLYGYPQVGYLQSGEQEESIITVFTTALNVGSNTGELIIYEQYPGNPLASIPVEIYAIGSPMISVTPPSLNFGDVILGNNPTLNLTINNYGSDTLQISSITSSNPDFALGDYEDFLLPYQEMILEVGFNANSLGSTSGDITIESNDALNPEVIVPVSANVYLQPPAYVNATIDNMDVNLQWEMEVSGEGDWLHFDSGESYSAIGLTSGGTWQHAARWFAGDLNNYAGKPVVKVAFFPRSANSQYTLKVWKGIDAQTTIISQVVNNYQLNQWNEIVIQNPFNIDPSEDLWVGFEVTQPADEYPASIDEGPAIIEQGDMINAGEGWISATYAYGLDFNWNIQVFVLDDNSNFNLLSTNPVIETNSKIVNQGIPVLGNLQPLTKKNPALKSPSSEVLGFNVYRDNIQLNSSLIPEQSYTDAGLEFGLYEYGVTAVYTEGESPQTTKMVQIGAPEISFDPTEILDSLENGETSSHIVNIENTGNFTLNWSAYPSATWMSISDSAGTLEPGENSELTIMLNSSALFAGTYEGSIAFEINNLNNPVVEFPIQLTVSGDAQLVITPDSVQFGLTAVNTTKTSYITITNIGNDYIFLESMNASPDVFSSVSFPVYLYPGGTISFPVYFTPILPGDFTGQLQIISGNPGGAIFEIPLSGTSLLPIPQNFTASLDSNNVALDWQSPIGGFGDYLQFCADESSNAIGYSGGGAFMVAAKFSPEELMTFNGGSLSSIGFVPWSENAMFTIKVWMGENAENLMLSQPVGFVTPMEWNDIQLNMQIPVDTSNYLWIGYEVVHEPDDFPAGCDMGPAVEGKGNLLSNDGIEWITLNYYGLDMNWSIRGLVDQDSKAMALTPLQNPIQQKLKNTGVLRPKFQPTPANLKSNSMSLELYGYNVYRDGLLLNDSLLITESEYNDLNLEPGIYNYEVTALYNLGESIPAGPLEINVIPAAASPIGWSPQPTAMTHIVHIPTQGSESDFMSPGDWIGVFFNDNGTMKCGGSIMWTDADSLKLIVYGDNPATSIKEGFAIGEWLTWKVFMSDTEEQHIIDVIYNPMMPDWDGNFTMLGESALTGMQLTTTGIDQLPDSKLNIFPNPNSGKFTIDGLDNFNKITLRNVAGLEIYTRNLNGEGMIDLSMDQPSGLYYLILQGNRNTEVRKIILQK